MYFTLLGKASGDCFSPTPDQPRCMHIECRPTLLVLLEKGCEGVAFGHGRPATLTPRVQSCFHTFLLLLLLRLLLTSTRKFVPPPPVGMNQ